MSRAPPAWWCLARVLARAVAGAGLGSALVLLGGGDLAFHGGPFAVRERVVAVELRGLAREPGLDSAHGRLGLGEPLALAQCPASGCVVAPALAFVCEPFALIGAVLARVGRLLAPVGEPLALIRGRVAAIGGRVAHGGRRRATFDGGRVLGRAALVFRVHLMDLGRLLVIREGSAVQRRGLAMDLGERGIRGLVQQALAALGGQAFAAGLLARPVAQAQGATDPCAMLLGARIGHGETISPLLTANPVGPESGTSRATDLPVISPGQGGSAQRGSDRLQGLLPEAPELTLHITSDTPPVRHSGDL
jgi:hypothetical protein